MKSQSTQVTPMAMQKALALFCFTLPFLAPIVCPTSFDAKGQAAKKAKEKTGKPVGVKAKKSTSPTATRNTAPKTRSRAALPPIHFTQFRLSNGLRVILHEDHSTPVVGVNVWYHVGSKNEVPG